MALQNLLDIVSKNFKKKNPDAEVDFRLASQEPPPLGLPVGNPLLEFLLDRRFLAFGRFYLIYGKKGSLKTTLFYDWAKMFQRIGGDVVWIETEHAVDLDYARKQGVDLSRISLIHPDSLEQGLELAEAFIRSMPKAYPEGDTPVLICFDSIAGATSEYELDSSHTITDMQPGTHARILGRFFREMEKPLANERCIFLMLNQLKSKIGGFGYGEDSQDALIGGEAQFFHSSYHLKMAKIGEIMKKGGEDEVERKFGSRHKIQCKRNKLGREGKGQEIEVDLYIDGGIDWWSPLVRKLGNDYASVVKKSGSFYYWNVPNTTWLNLDNKPELIDVDKAYRETELGAVIARSQQAQDAIRKVFGIPDLPTDKEVAEIETTRKKKRKNSEKEEPAVTVSTEKVTKALALMEQSA